MISTHWSSKHEKRGGHGCAWCSGMSLPAWRHICEASLLAPLGRFVTRSCLPLPWALPPSQQIPLPQEAEVCQSFWHLIISPLCSCCCGCPWGGLTGPHTRCLWGVQLSLAAPRVQLLALANASSYPGQWILRAGRDGFLAAPWGSNSSTL